MMSYLRKSLREVNTLYLGLSTCHSKRYASDGRKHKMGKPMLEPEYMRSFPDDGKSPFVNFNRFMNLFEIDYSLNSMRHYLQHRINRHEVLEQSLDTEKLERLGADLTAAHTFVRLRGRVQFAGFDKWIAARGDRMPLPNYKVDNLHLQVADLTGTKVLYEGLECLEGTSLTMLILKDCKNIDDFCLSRLSVVSDTLEFLDISGCSQVTDNGLGALQKLRNLKYLRINDLPNAGNKSLVSLLLQEDNPDLTVLGVDLEALDYMTENSQAPENTAQDSLSTKQSSSDSSQKQADSEKT